MYEVGLTRLTQFRGFVLQSREYLKCITMTALVITASGAIHACQKYEIREKTSITGLRLPTFLLFARNYLAHHPFLVNDPDITWRSQSTVLVGESRAGPEA